MRRLESGAYEFDARDVDILKSATEEVHGMALAAVRHAIEHRMYATMGVAEAAVPLIERSWAEDAPGLCDRLDFAYDGANPPKLLDYTTDPLRGLAESQGSPGPLRERLTGRWAWIADSLPGRHVDFCSLQTPADCGAIAFLAEAARDAGLDAAVFPISEIGWNGRAFIGPDGSPLAAVYKLYPWDWMVKEAFGRHLLGAATLWIEPAWKMLLANKAILAILWKLYPRHPNLLEAALDGPALMMSWVKKPVWGRGGAGMTLHQPGQDSQAGAAAEHEIFVWQELAPRASFDGMHPVIGAWAVDRPPGDPFAGLAVRESTAGAGTAAVFVPHTLR